MQKEQKATREEDNEDSLAGRQSTIEGKERETGE